MREKRELRSFRSFVRRAWDTVEAVPLVWNWHIDAVCGLLENVTLGKITDLIINVPPGCMKSYLVSVFWPAWEWSQDPALKYMCASYGQHLSTRDNMNVLKIVTAPWYKRHFGLRLDETGQESGFELDASQKAKQYFKTTQGGWRLGTSVGGVGTGEHPDRKIIDDPHTAAQADSAAERKTAINWVDQTMSTRGVSRGARTVVIMQRLDMEDLTAHLLGQGGWTHVMFPMRYEAKRACVLDPRKIEGELLWPGLFTEEIVKKLEIKLGPYGTAGQMQQRPAPAGGGLFKRSWFKIVDHLPLGPDGKQQSWRRTRGWDTAGTEGAGDYTVGVKIARCGPTFVVEDVERGQWGPAKVETTMLSTAQRDGKACRQREEKEPGSSGVSVITSRAKLLVGYDYRGVPISGSKVVRAGPYRAQCEMGNVLLLRGAWNEAYLAELELFPNGSNDDQTDGSSASFNDLTAGPEPMKTRPLGMG